MIKEANQRLWFKCVKLEKKVVVLEKKVDTAKEALLIFSMLGIIPDCKQELKNRAMFAKKVLRDLK